MRTLVSGATGLMGQAIGRCFEDEGHEVIALTRRAGVPHSIRWNPDAGELDPTAIEGFDAVINLAGDPIAEGRWNPDKKAEIRNSRVNSTRLLAQSLAAASSKPRVLISGSAIGIYGDRGSEELTESSKPGDDFLAEVGVAWEAAAAAAASSGIRVACIRTGVVLAREGGALPKMLPAFKKGLGGALGSGKQWMSWIAIGDVGPALLHIARTESLSGPVNLTAPNPVTNREFTRALAIHLRRPAILSAPPIALRAMFGEFADAVLLASQRVIPRKLMESGFTFRYPVLHKALESVLD